MNNVLHSIDLDMTYRIRRGKLLFEDGVEYTIKEAVMVSRACDVPPSQADDVRETVRSLHAIKKAFGGVIQAGPQAMEEAEVIEDTANGAARSKTMPAVRQEKNSCCTETVQTSLW